MKEKLKNLLAKSVFISHEYSKKIQAKLDILSEAQLKALIVVLEDADTLQVKLISKVLETHPDFLDFLEQYSAKKINNIRKEAEEKDNKEDEQRMKTLIEEVEVLE
jgi:hypothetical protein